LETKSPLIVKGSRREKTKTKAIKRCETSSWCYWKL